MCRCELQIHASFWGKMLNGSRNYWFKKQRGFILHPFICFNLCLSVVLPFLEHGGIDSFTEAPAYCNVIMSYPAMDGRI